MEAAILRSLCYLLLLKSSTAFSINQNVANLLREYDLLSRSLHQNYSRLQWKCAMDFQNTSLKQLRVIVSQIKALDEAWYYKLSAYKGSRQYLRKNLMNRIDALPVPQKNLSEANKNFQKWKISTFVAYNPVKPTVTSIYSLCDIDYEVTIINLNKPSVVSSVDHEQLIIPPPYLILRDVESKSDPKFYGRYEIDDVHLRGRCLYRNYMEVTRNERVISRSPMILSSYHNMIKYYKECCLEPEVLQEYNVTMSMLEEVIDFYSLFHAYVKHQIDIQHGSRMPRKTIPIHLTGDIWGSSWYDLIKTLKLQKTDLFEAVVNDFIDTGNLTLLALAHYTEQYFVSMGFSPLPSTFWNDSFIKNSEGCSNISIKDALAYNMYKDGQVRLIMCLDPSYDSWTQIFHQMGHIYYLRSYQSVSILTQKNSYEDYVETLGDLVAISALDPNNKFMRQLVRGLGSQYREITNLTYQLVQAAHDLPMLMYYLAIKTWNNRMFGSEAIKPNNSNTEWWNIVGSIQGLHHPNHNSYQHQDSRGRRDRRRRRRRIFGLNNGSVEDDQLFDIGLSYYVSRNGDVDKFLRAMLLKYQIFQGLRDSGISVSEEEVAEGEVPNANGFDMYGSHSVGNKLRQVMMQGTKINWRNRLYELTSKSFVDAQSLLDYYQPLIEFLRSENEASEITDTWKPTVL